MSSSGDFWFNGNGNVRGGRVFVAVVGVIVGIVFIISLFSMWPFDSVPNGYVGMSYGGGLFESQHFQGEKIGPQGFFFNGWGDHLYLYPTTQRNYIISQNANEGDRKTADSIVAPTSDRINVTYQTAVYFKLNLDKLPQFHNQIGLKYHAWCETGNPDCSNGWQAMLDASFRQQIESALQQESRSFTSVAIYSDPNTLLQIQKDVGSVLEQRVASVLGDDYFCGPSYIAGSQKCPSFTFIIKNATLPSGVVAEYEKNQESLIAVQTEKNKVQQANFQAQQIQIVSDALKNASDQYTLLQAINSGKVTFWVLPNGQNITVPASGGAVPKP